MLAQDDNEQRLMALNVNKSFIIQAPAGSGKTELLIQRFLALLSKVKTPEEILAITFTKKSANEMRLRVVKALKHALNHPEPESQHAKKTWQLAKAALLRDEQCNWNLINNPNQLSIQTIDSLCAYLTRQLPLLAHFGAQPDLTDHPIILYREAVQEILLHVEGNYAWSQAIANLLLHLDNDLNKLHDLLINLLAKRDQWLPYIRLDANETEIKKDLEHHLQAINNEHINYLKEIFPQEIIPELISNVRFAANNLLEMDADADLLSLRDLNKLPANKQTWLGLAKLLLTKNYTWRKRLDTDIGFPALNSLTNSKEKLLHTEYRKSFSELILLLSSHEDLRLALRELSFLPDKQYQESQWHILQSLLLILKILTAQLRITFQQHGQIDFIENTQAALLALGNDDSPTDLALALDYQIQHILIDEFQDTSISQYQLLEKLLIGWENDDGKTLFVVGDPMQSIYRFREAEVGLFLRMRKNGIGHIHLIPLTLFVNFRSQHQLVNWNNQQYQFIFPSINHIANGAVTFNASRAQQINQEESVISISGYLDADDKIQAAHIVEQIQTIKKSSSEKIAILVRSRSHLSALIPALKNANIAYRAVDIDPLESRQHIQDLVSLTSALLHPIDRIAWLAILRAPWCGLTLNDLYLLAHENPFVSIWEQLLRKDLITTLSIDGQKRLARILPILKMKMAERERYNLRYWIESTWLQLGGPASLQQYDDILDIQAFFQLLDELAQSNQIFSRDKLKEKIIQLYAPPQHDDSVLQIMTIHTAKGLEFDTVILPYLEKKMPHDDKALLAWLERPLTNGQSTLLLASIHETGRNKDSIYEYITRQQKIKSDYEIDRLLYVATTRAKKNLYLYFNATTTTNNEIRINSGSFLSKLWPCLEKDKDHILTTAHLNINKDNNSTRFIRRLHSDWNHPNKETVTSQIILHQQQSGFQLLDSTPRIIGSTIHRILQKISELGLSWWNDTSIDAQEKYLRQHLIQLGISIVDIEAAIKNSQRALKNMLSDKQGQWILKPHHSAQSEFALTVFLNDQIENLIIDRTFIDETNTRWIIDYKTATTENNIDQFISHEEEKYTQQMQKYYHAMRLIEDRPIRLGLYFPLLTAWKEIIMV